MHVHVTNLIRLHSHEGIAMDWEAMPAHNRVKHPYVCLLKFKKHSLVQVMSFKGPTILVLKSNDLFKEDWRKNPLQLAFFEDIGMTALNLVPQCRRGTARGSRRSE
jgi:hypothetical protein